MTLENAEEQGISDRNLQAAKRDFGRGWPRSSRADGRQKWRPGNDGLTRPARGLHSPACRRGTREHRNTESAPSAFDGLREEAKSHGRTGLRDRAALCESYSGAAGTHDTAGSREKPRSRSRRTLDPSRGRECSRDKKPNSSARDWSTTKTAGGLVVANPNHTRRAGAKLRRERNPMSVAGRTASSTGQAATSPGGSGTPE